MSTRLNHRILIVEDGAITAHLLHDTLERLGYSVVGIAGSAAQARELVDTTQPDLVLMDVHLGGGDDGIDVATRWAAERHLPVVFLTAFADDATLARAGAAAGYGYLVKPFRERELHATLLVALERGRREALLRDNARRDPLTGLPNRLAALDHLQQALHGARRHGELAAVLFVDLDDFKPVNDTLGHAAGDRVLCAVAERLLAGVRGEDTVARVGGDEFLLVLGRLQQREDVVRAAAKLLARLTEPLQIDATAVDVGASIGVAVFPHDGVDGASLLRAADAAMYTAKGAGGRRCAFVDADPQQRSPRDSLLGDLAEYAEAAPSGRRRASS